MSNSFWESFFQLNCPKIGTFIDNTTLSTIIFFMKSVHNMVGKDGGRFVCTVKKIQFYYICPKNLEVQFDFNAFEFIFMWLHLPVEMI